MLARLGHKWHIWLAWTVQATVIAVTLQLISLTTGLVFALENDCSSSKDFNLSSSSSTNADHLLVVPECFSRRCQYHRQCSSDCPNTFCSSGGRCLCESGFRVDLTTQSCLKEVPLWLMLTVMGAIFAVAYLITFCCLKHDLLHRLKQLRPEVAVHFTAVNQHRQSSSRTGQQHQRRPSLDNLSISSSSSSSLNDTLTQCPSSFPPKSFTAVPLSGSASAGAARRTPIPGQAYVTNNPKGHASTANYENITPETVVSTEI